MLTKVYKKIIEQAAHPKATWLLGLISFTESSISPIPPDPLMVPMIIAHPKRAWFLSALCTITSVVGGAVGYAIGYFLFEKVGMSIIEFYNLTGAFHQFQTWFEKWGFWLIVAKGLTPIPYKVVTITCGAIQFHFMEFIIASTLSRGMRFFIEGALVWKYGAVIHRLLERYTAIIFFSLVAVLLLGFLVIAYLV